MDYVRTEAAVSCPGRALGSAPSLASRNVGRCLRAEDVYTAVLRGPEPVVAEPPRRSDLDAWRSVIHGRVRDTRQPRLAVWARVPSVLAVLTLGDAVDGGGNPISRACAQRAPR